MRSQQQPLPFSTCTRSRVIAIAVAAVVAMPIPALAVDIFPPNEPDKTYDEDVNGASGGSLPAGITQYNWTGVSSGIGTSASAPTCGGGFWGTHLVQTGANADIRSTVSGDVGIINRIHPLGPGGKASVFVVDQSMAGHASYDSQDWENFRFEFDFHGDANAAVGVVWGGQPVAAPNTDYEINHGYLFYIDELPEDQIALPPTSNAQWHLVKRQSGYDLELASGEIVLNDSVQSLMSVYRDQCYRLRLEYFCDTMRISIARIDCGAATCTVTQCNGTTNVCSPEDYSGCANPIQWCTLVDWVDPMALNPGLVGTFAGSIDQSPPPGAASRFDNLVASAWDYDCNALCSVATSWTSWTDDWDASTIAADGVQDIELKYLYTGAVVDSGYGALFRASAWEDAFIDVTAWSEPTDVIQESDGAAVTRLACGGWTVLYTNTEKPVVDLPDPTDTSSNLAELMAFLQPMSSAVKLVYDATEPLPEDRYSFVDDFDNVRLDAITGLPNPDYNPAPLPAVGSTPIAASLMDAYLWYDYQKSSSGAWYNEPLEDCRLWYVIFITDGEEACSSNLAQVCEPGEAASLFAAPPSGIEPVKVYTVGFSEDFDPSITSPLQCIATDTGGRFFSATDAGQLVDVLYLVLNEMQETDRSFIPYAVSPPPPGAAGQLSADEEFLTIYPRFVPINERSVWNGDLFAFEFNQSQPTLPTTTDCQVDLSQVVWRDSANNPTGAETILAKQMDDYTDVDPTRFVFMGSDYDGSWERYLVKDTFSDTLLMADFRDLLDVSSAASVSVLEAVEVVNHLRNIYTNPAALSLATPPQTPPRPDPSSSIDDVSALGDVYHSQPVVVNPPNNFLYFSDFGQGPAHDYMSFLLKHQKRRRVVLAGANDGQLHAFDGGMYDRDETNYDNRHDMGTGMEVFSWVPEAVSHRLSRMTYGSEHQYMVDGLISTSDVFIDPDGSGGEPEQWRTVALATMRRGGRGVLALDITTPDPITGPDFIPAAADFPGCVDSTSAQCDGLSYPHMLWEFHDVDGSGTPNDDDGGCALALLTGDDCRPYWDLGWTWSKPAIARIGVYSEDVGGNVVPDDTYVAFFGGGWDASLNPDSPASEDITGNYFYAVDIETGATVLKVDIEVSVPGAPTLLDSDNDGYHDRIYFGDTNGRIWRLEFPSPYRDFTTFPGSPPPATVFEAAELKRIFDVSTTSLTTTYGRQHFFNKPTLVPALFNGSNYEFAVLIGAGDRANLGDETANITNHFYVVLDDIGDIASGDLPYDESDLQHIAYDDAGILDAFTVVPGETACTDNHFNTAKGWYLELREDEKVNFEAMVFANHVFLTTFEPGEGLTAANPVEICTPAPGPTPTPGPGPTPTPTPPPGGGGSGVPPPVCKASGLGRIYDLGLTCGLGEFTEVNDIVTGISTYTIGNTSYFVFTGSGAGTPGTGGLGGSKQPPIGVISSTSNWRQE